MTTELILLGTAAAPMPVAGRAGTASTLVVDEHIFLVDCGRGTPTGFVNAGLDFRSLDAIFVTHLHVDHVGDLPGLLLYPWGIRRNDDGPLPPIQVYGPGSDLAFAGKREPSYLSTRFRAPSAAPGTCDLVQGILTAFSYHLNVMPLDAEMPDPSNLVHATDIVLPTRNENGVLQPTQVFEGFGTQVTAIAVTHGHAYPALAYRFDTVDGAVVFSGDTTANADLIDFAKDADILVHSVADLDYLERHGMTRSELRRMAGLHTDVKEVGRIAQRARVKELVLTHYLPADPNSISGYEWAMRAGRTFGGITTAGHDGLRRVLDGSTV